MREKRYIARISRLPRALVERSLYDAVLHAAIHQYASTDEELSVEEVLTRLVLLQSDMRKEQMQRELERLKSETRLFRV